MFCDRGGAVVESRKRGMKMQDRYLFKAKRKDNCEWVQGYYVKGLNVLTNCEETHIIFEPNTIFYSSGETDGWYRVDPSTICRCTELKDKNGKLIWENDIVSFVHEKYATDTLDFAAHKYTRNYVIEFEKTFCNYGLRFRNKSTHFRCTQATLCTHDCEVIGNSIDNPELLEV